MIAASYRPPFFTQILYVALCVIWNGVGIWQRSLGEMSIGPTASWSAIIILLFILGFLWLCLNRTWPMLYLLASLGLGFLAALAIDGAVSKDPSLWPSEFWRYAGAGVNAIGVLSLILAIIAATKQGLSLQGLRGK